LHLLPGATQPVFGKNKQSEPIEDPATREMMACWNIGILGIKSENFLFLITGFETHTSNPPLFQFSSSTDEWQAEVFNSRNAGIFKH
jgi:hypothetical protein